MLGWMLYSPVVLILLALILRQFKLSANSQEPWRASVDMPLLIGVALCSVVLSSQILYEPALDGQVSTCDYIDICTSTEYIRQLNVDDRALLVTRQPGAGLLPSLLAKFFGIINGVALASILSSLITSLAISGWARIIAGRSAAIIAGFSTCTIAALVVQSRHLSFYPETVAGYALSAMGAAAVLRYRNVYSLALAGLGVGAALFVDHPGLLYALPPLAIAIYCGLQAPVRRLPIRLLALLLPIVLSWIVAHNIVPPELPRFEDKMMIYLHDSKGYQLKDPNITLDELQMRGEAIPWILKIKAWSLSEGLFVPIHQMPVRPGYLWGHSGPTQILRSMVAIAVLSTEAGSTPPSQEIWDYTEQIDHHVKPWIPISIFCLVLTLFRLRKRPMEALGLLAILLPYVMSFRVLLGTQVWPKLMMAPVIPIPFLMGSAFCLLAFKEKEHEEVEAAWRPWSSPITSLIIASLLVTGVVPSWLSPTAPWRISFKLCGDIYGPYINAERRLMKKDYDQVNSEEEELCEQLFMNDIQSGYSSNTWIYPDPERIHQAEWNHQPQP